MEWIDKAIVSYLKDNLNKDSIDICSYFKLRVDIIMDSISRLTKDNIIERVHLSGSNYVYKIK